MTYKVKKPAKTQKTIETPRTSKPVQEPAPVLNEPSLRMALWLYFFVLLGTMFVMIELGSNVEPLFLRFITTLVIVLGLTIGTLFLFKIKMFTLFGRRPELVSLVASIAAGLAIWVPFFWISDLFFGLLENTIGKFPNPQFALGEPSSYLVQYAILIPLCQGLLFWGFIQRPAQKTFRIWGVLLTAVLFAFFGMFGTDAAISAIPGFLLVGLLASFAVYYTDSIWYGVGILAGYNLGLPLLLTPFLNNYFSIQTDLDTYQNLFSLRWILAIAVTGFLAFALFQVIRLRAAAPLDAPRKRISIGRYWWIPLGLSAGLLLFAISGEFTLRSQSRPVIPVSRGSQKTTTGSGGSSAPPVPPPVPGR